MSRPPVAPPEFRVPPVDAIALEGRAAELGTRSIKKEAKRQGLLMALRMTDLTTLEGSATPGARSLAMCKQGRPPSTRISHPSRRCASIPDLVKTAVETVRGSAVAVASVATGFPSGRTAISTSSSKRRGDASVTGRRRSTW